MTAISPQPSCGSLQPAARSSSSASRSRARQCSDQLAARLEQQLKARLADRHIDFELTGPAREWLSESGYDPVYGARPLKRLIRQELESPMARKLISGDVKDGESVKACVENGKLALTA